MYFIQVNSNLCINLKLIYYSYLHILDSDSEIDSTWSFLSTNQQSLWQMAGDDVDLAWRNLIRLDVIEDNFFQFPEHDLDYFQIPRNLRQGHITLIKCSYVTHSYSLCSELTRYMLEGKSWQTYPWRQQCCKPLFFCHWRLSIKKCFFQPCLMSQSLPAHSTVLPCYYSQQAFWGQTV